MCLIEHTFYWFLTAPLVVIAYCVSRNRFLGVFIFSSCHQRPREVQTSWNRPDIWFGRDSVLWTIYERSRERLSKMKSKYAILWPNPDGQDTFKSIKMGKKSVQSVLWAKADRSLSRPTKNGRRRNERLKKWDNMADRTMFHALTCPSLAPSAPSTDH